MRIHGLHRSDGTTCKRRAARRAIHRGGEAPFQTVFGGELS
jgi:hypothetical protein